MPRVLIHKGWLNISIISVVYCTVSCLYDHRPHATREPFHMGARIGRIGVHIWKVPFAALLGFVYFTREDDRKMRWTISTLISDELEDQSVLNLKTPTFAWPVS
jgi:hypothetical protein